MKPVYSHLRSIGVLVMGYIDDILQLSDDKEKLHSDIHMTTSLLKSLGFTIHDVKSTLKPC